MSPGYNHSQKFTHPVSFHLCCPPFHLCGPLPPLKPHTGELSVSCRQIPEVFERELEQ